MRILGLGDCWHDNGVALIEDGRVVAAINEERLSRRKFDVDLTRSLDYVFDRLGIDPSGIDAVALAGVDEPELAARLGRDEENWRRLGGRGSRLSSRAHRLFRRGYRAKVARLLKRYGLADKPLTEIDHHTAHAAGAYLGSGQDPVLVFSADGWGDGYAGGCFACRDGSVETIHLIDNTGSAGLFYGAVTSLLGFNPMRHAGKITGLAAYGGPSAAAEIVEASYRLQDRMPRLDPAYYQSRSRFKGLVPLAARLSGATLVKGWRGFFEQLARYLLSTTREYHSPLLKKSLAACTPQDVAYAFQKNLEKVLRAYVDGHLAKFGPAHVALTGGVFANVRLNQLVGELPGVKSVYVFPNMGDGGLALGAAWHLWLEARRSSGRAFSPRPLTDLYLGWRASTEEIIAALEPYRAQLQWLRHEDGETAIAEHLAAGRVVARYAGGLEYGPRALGNRSILYHAADPSVNDWLNKRLRRTEFMPFAPATPWEYRHDYYLMDDRDWRTAEYMTITFDTTDLMRRQCPAAVHVDGTARPQLVRREINPSFYRIIDEYRRLTGVATIINTSFNMHEEPIVATPDDALRAFMAGAGDCLFMEDFEITRSGREG